MSDKPANPVTTNADRIRRMSDKELAEWHEKPCPPGKSAVDCEDNPDCGQCWLDWLDSPTESEG